MKYSVGQYVVVYDDFSNESVKCIIRSAINDMYGVEPLDFLRTIPTVYSEREIHETKKDCLEYEYNKTKEFIKNSEKKLKSIKEQLKDIT